MDRLGGIKILKIAVELAELLWELTPSTRGRPEAEKGKNIKGVVPLAQDIAEGRLKIKDAKKILEEAVSLAIQAIEYGNFFPSAESAICISAALETPEIFQIARQTLENFEEMIR